MEIITCTFLPSNIGVQVHLSTGGYKNIYFNYLSGQKHFRYKLAPSFNVKHTGIYIGQDEFGKEYYIHNHIDIGRAELVTKQEYSEGKQIHFTEKCSNDRNSAISIAFGYVLRRQHYDLLSNNCQTLANDACHNQRKSQAVDNALGGLFFAGILLLVGGAIAAASED